MLGRVKLEKTSSERVSQPFQITLPSSFADICNSFFGNSMIRKPKRYFFALTKRKYPVCVSERNL